MSVRPPQGDRSAPIAATGRVRSLAASTARPAPYGLERASTAHMDVTSRDCVAAHTRGHRARIASAEATVLAVWLKTRGVIQTVPRPRTSRLARGTAESEPRSAVEPRRT